MESAQGERRSPLRNDFDLFINHLTVFPIRMNPFCHRLQRLLQMRRIVSNHRTTNDGFLPLVLQIQFCGRDIELAVQTRDERLDLSALFFERGTDRKVKMNDKGGEHDDSKFSVYEFRIPLYNPSHV